MNGDTVILSKEEYDYLIERDEILSALEEYGVDNWEYYGDALQEYYGDEEDE